MDGFENLRKTGFFCTVCYEPQYQSPSGAVCRNGHGGAFGLTVEEVAREAGRKHRLAPLMSAAKDDWETPDDLYEECNREFGFTLDVAASAKNAKCARFYDEARDGLTMPWALPGQEEVCWLNPPYGRKVLRWLRKALLEAERGATVVALLPSRTDTVWFHECVLGKAEVRFLRGRLTFKGAPAPAPFPSLIAIFRPR